MSAGLSDAQLQVIAHQIEQNPTLLRELQTNGQRLTDNRMSVSNPNLVQSHGGGLRQDPGGFFRKYGINFPDAEDYQVQQDRSGRVQLVRNNWLQRNGDWFVPVMAFGAPFAAAALTGGLTAATTAGTTTLEDGTVVSTSTGLPVAASGSAAGPASTLGTAAATGVKAASALTHTPSTSDHLIRALTGLIPLLAGRGGNSSSNTGLFGEDGKNKEITHQIATMLGLQNERAMESQPIHQAALRLAGQLAPTSQSSPRLNAAIGQAGAPMPQGGMDPQVTAALQRLMGGA